MANPYLAGAQIQSSQSAMPERQPGTLEMVQGACKRLFDLRERLCNISNALHGPRPQDTGQAAAPAPANLSSYVQQLHQAIGECEYEVAEIFQSLGIK